MDGGSAGSWL